MDKKSQDENMQQKYMQYNVYKQQAQGLLQEMNLLNQTSKNIAMAREVLSNLENAKEKSEVLVPIGGNTFLKTKIDDIKNVLIGVGSDIVVKKPISEAIDTINEQLENLKKSGEDLASEMQRLENKMREIEPELQKYMAHAQEKHSHAHK